jgi:phosphonate transport system substrate-binding protein
MVPWPCEDPATPTGWVAVVAMRDMDINFTTQFITHPDSDLQTVQDVKGKRFAFASRGSVQAGLLAYYFLKQTGVDPEKDLGACHLR